MLDQNTDRMWYVIGAVLIGAAIILAANTLFPDIFQNMAQSFSGMLQKATGGLGDIEFSNIDTSAPPAETINLIKGIF